jgi:hypothetical protein
MNNRAEISAEELRRRLSYDPETGIFLWKITSPAAPAGSVAGGRDREGYWRIRIAHKKYYAHRLAWLYIYGEMPSVFVDHKNGKRTDNRLDNLRLADRCQNLWNRGAQRNSITGSKGVYFTGRPWVAVIRVRKRTIHLGRFRTKEEAEAAYSEAAKRHHAEFASTQNQEENTLFPAPDLLRANSP